MNKDSFTPTSENWLHAHSAYVELRNKFAQTYLTKRDEYDRKEAEHKLAIARNRSQIRLVVNNQK